MTERIQERAVVWETPRFFGIRIEGNEYEPFFSRDDVVYVDAGISPAPDEICFVIFGRKACFRFFDGRDGRETRFTRINDLSDQDVIGSESPLQPIIMRVMGVRRGLRLYPLRRNAASCRDPEMADDLGLLSADPVSH